VIGTAHEVASFWVANGGPAKSAVAWASVSRAESSWDTEAVSPTDARGWYQIEPYSWPAGAGDISGWDQPGPNSRAAVLLSGGGVNFAAWDTAYADINASGRYTFLAWPENGSAAWDNMPTVAGMLGTTYYGGVTPPVVPGLSGTLPDALRWYAQQSDVVLPALITATRAYSDLARRMYR
jgi:hypothetical protein